ncbi:MAG: hypothetical protein RL078_386 [Bacteroidota bacterium]
MKLSTLLASVLIVQSFSAQVIEKPKEIEPVQVIEENLTPPPPVEVEEAVGDQIIEITTVEVAGPKAASFPGGPDSLMAYLASQVEVFILQDTNEIFPFGEQVFVVFEVATDGQILNPKVELGYNAFLDSAALRIIRDMPKWEPATNELDEPVVSTNRVTITFDLFLDEDMSDFEDWEEADEMQFKTHLASFEFGTSINTNAMFGFDPTFANNPEWENVPTKSSVFNMNLFSYKFKLIDQYLGLATGYGFNFTNTEFNAPYTLQHNANSVTAVLDTTQSFKRNALYGVYFTVPVMFEITNKGSFKDAFYLNFGVVAGARIYSHQRQTGTYENGDKFEWITRSKFNMNPYMLDATVRLGYGHFGVFANYALLSTFKKDMTAAIYPMRFGVSLNIPQ